MKIATVNVVQPLHAITSPRMFEHAALYSLAHWQTYWLTYAEVDAWASNSIDTHIRSDLNAGRIVSGYPLRRLRSKIRQQQQKERAVHND
jgi:hypothetical protein